VRYENPALQRGFLLRFSQKQKGREIFPVPSNDLLTDLTNDGDASAGGSNDGGASPSADDASPGGASDDAHRDANVLVQA
jgi:hypothetical protein